MCWKGKHAKLAWTFSWNITVFGIVNLQVHEKHENFVFLRPTLQRHNIRKFERKKILPDNELCGLSLISTSMCLRAIYICPWSVCLCCCRKIFGQILGIYKSLTDTWMWKLGLRPRNYFLGTHIWDFCCNACWIKLGFQSLLVVAILDTRDHEACILHTKNLCCVLCTVSAVAYVRGVDVSEGKYNV